MTDARKMRVTLITREGEEIEATITRPSYGLPEVVVLPEGSRLRLFLRVGDGRNLFGRTKYRYAQTSAVSIAEVVA